MVSTRLVSNNPEKDGLMIQQSNAQVNEPGRRRTKSVPVFNGVATNVNKADTVEICIEDNGTGIPDAVRNKIFQPFFTTKPTGEGTGLGLSLSYDIITKGHGGTLTAESSETGTTFIITMPQ